MGEPTDSPPGDDFAVQHEALDYQRECTTHGKDSRRARERERERDSSHSSHRFVRRMPSLCGSRSTQTCECLVKCCLARRYENISCKHGVRFSDIAVLRKKTSRDTGRSPLEKKRSRRKAHSRTSGRRRFRLRSPTPPLFIHTTRYVQPQTLPGQHHVSTQGNRQIDQDRESYLPIYLSSRLNFLSISLAVYCRSFHVSGLVGYVFPFSSARLWGLSPQQHGGSQDFQ